MKFFLFIFSLTLLPYVCPQRIQEGQNLTDPTKFPFFAMFIITEQSPNGGITKRTCGSSLIHPQWILTAGHCLPNDTSHFDELIGLDSDMIFMGSTSVQPTPYSKARKIIEIHRHPDYVNKYDLQNPKLLILLNDIALLKLNTPFTLSNTLQRVRLSTSHRECEYVIAIGIGNTFNYTGNSLSKVVKYAKLQVKHLNIQTGSNSVFFAQNNHENEESGNALPGDSGGPFICDEVFPPLQIGVLSGAITTNLGDYDMIERIDYFIDFIIQHLPKDKFTEYLEESKKKEQLRAGSKGTKLILTILIYFTNFFMYLCLTK